MPSNQEPREPAPFRSGEDILHEVFEMIENRGQRGLETGYFELDDMLNGLQKSELIVLGSRPGMGKSALASNIVEHIAADSLLPVAVITMEMTHEQYMQRMFMSRAQIDGHKMRRGMLQSHEHAHIANMIGALAKAPIFVTSVPRLYLDQLCDIAHKVARDKNAMLLVVDYVQLIEAEGNNRAEQLALVSRRLKSLAMELKRPILALSELNRGMFKPEAPRPRFEDLRGSGTLEDEADVVILLHREDYYRMSEPDFVPDNLAELIVAKQRNGPTGTVKLTFMNKTTRFENLSGRDPF